MILTVIQRKYYATTYKTVCAEPMYILQHPSPDLQAIIHIRKR